MISVRVKMERPANSNSSDEELAVPAWLAVRALLQALRHAQHAERGHEVITGQGSGFFITADGYAVTNNHVVQNAENVKVTTDDGKTYDAKVIGTDTAHRPRSDQGRRQ